MKPGLCLFKVSGMFREEVMKPKRLKTKQNKTKKNATTSF